MFHLVTHSYCGMSLPHLTTEDRAWARAQTAALLRKRRRAGFRVVLGSRTEDYRSYEVLEPAVCYLVPDECGIIALRRELFACGECGSEYDQQEAARQCCCEFCE